MKKHRRRCGRCCFRSITLSSLHADFKCILKRAFFFCLLKKDDLVVTMADCPTCGSPTLLDRLNSQATSLIPPGSQKRPTIAQEDIFIGIYARQINLSKSKSTIIKQDYIDSCCKKTNIYRKIPDCYQRPSQLQVQLWTGFLAAITNSESLLLFLFNANRGKKWKETLQIQLYHYNRKYSS